MLKIKDNALEIIDKEIENFKYQLYQQTKCELEMYQAMRMQNNYEPNNVLSNSIEKCFLERHIIYLNRLKADLIEEIGD